MPIAYFILIIISFVFARFHWPGVPLLILLGVAVMFADVIVQLIRLMMSKIHVSTLLGAIALFLLSLGYTFLWLWWPGNFLLGITAAVLSLGYVVYFMLSKRKATVRFAITALMTMVVLAFVSMKPSTFLCFKANIDPQNPKAPVFILHDLAWRYNTEGNKSAALQLLLQEQRYVQEHLNRLEGKSDAGGEFYIDVYQKDAERIREAIVATSQGNWSYYEPLEPIDGGLD